MNSLFCWRPVQYLVLAMLSAFPGRAAESNSPTPGRSELVRCLDSLRDPTLDNAVETARQLRTLADSQQGQEKAATEKLITEVRNLFYGELVVTTAKKNRIAAEQQAAAKEKAAASWLRPNVFGSVNRNGHQKALKEAQSLRASSRQQMEQAKQKLVEAVRATDAAIQSYDRAGQKEVKATLENATKAVVARSLQSSFLGSGEEGEFNRQVLGALAVMGLMIWASSNSNNYRPQASNVNPGLQDQIARSRERDEEARREQSRRDDAAADQQRQRWAEEAERAARARAP